MKNTLRLLSIFISSLLVLYSGVASAAPVIDHSYQLVSSVRVGRTEYDYAYRAKITNNGPALLNVSATVSSSSPNTKIIDGNVNFGNLAAGAVASGSDTFTIRQNRSFVFDPNSLAWNVQFEIAPQTIPPEGAEIQGENDTVLIVPPGATNAPIQVTITPLQESGLGTTPPPNTTFLGGANIDMGQNELTDNADISMPAPPGVPDGAEVYLANVVEYAGQSMFQMVDTAIVQNGIITSQDPAFPGIKSSGKFAFLWAPNVGWVSGQVKRSNVAVLGAVVTLSGGYWLDIADGTGNYSLPAWAGNFVVVAFDPITGDHGEKQGFMASSGSSVVANITIGTSTGPVQSTIINGDFETGDLTGWQLSGGGEVVSSFGPIVPHQGSYMGKITSGDNAIGGASSALEQSFKVPAGATTLKIRYNFVSEEYPEYVGSSFNDVFNATLFTPDGSKEIAFEEVNSAPFSPVSGVPCGSGDCTWGQTGWREATINVSAWAGKDDTITLSVHDVGDTVYDTVVLLDEIEISSPAKIPVVTVWDWDSIPVGFFCDSQDSNGTCTVRRPNYTSTYARISNLRNNESTIEIGTIDETFALASVSGAYQLITGEVIISNMFDSEWNDILNFNDHFNTVWYPNNLSNNTFEVISQPDERSAPSTTQNSNAYFFSYDQNNITLDDWVDYLAEISSEYEKRIDTLVVYAHGNTGLLKITNSSSLITTNDLQTNSTIRSSFTRLQNILSANAHILLFSCNTGQDVDFIRELAILTGAHVHANSNFTGSPSDEVPWFNCASNTSCSDWQLDRVCTPTGDCYFEQNVTPLPL